MIIEISVFSNNLIGFSNFISLFNIFSRQIYKVWKLLSVDLIFHINRKTKIKYINFTLIYCSYHFAHLTLLLLQLRIDNIIYNQKSIYNQNLISELGLNETNNTRYIFKSFLMIKDKINITISKNQDL